MTGNLPLDAVLADMLAYEAHKFDGAWFATSGGVSVGPFDTEAEAEAYAANEKMDWRGAWAVEFRDTGDISGCDLVEAFAEWRSQIKLALGIA